AQGPFRIELVADEYAVEQSDDTLARERLAPDSAREPQQPVGELHVGRGRAVLAAAERVHDVLGVARVDARREIIALAAVTQQQISVDERGVDRGRARGRAGR